MLRISKLTDYGIVLLAHLARGAGATANARELAEATALPFPAVGKVLKALAARACSSRTAARRAATSSRARPSQITVAEIIEALEGPIALMECNAGPGHCEQEASCHVRDPWQRIHSHDPSGR